MAINAGNAIPISIFPFSKTVCIQLQMLLTTEILFLILLFVEPFHDRTETIRRVFIHFSCLPNILQNARRQKKAGLISRMMSNGLPALIQVEKLSFPLWVKNKSAISPACKCDIKFGKVGIIVAITMLPMDNSGE